MFSFDNPVQAQRGVKTANNTQNAVGVSLKKSREEN
jgi:hypothetical protein